MDIKLLLIKSITIVYLSSIAKENAQNVHNIIKEVLQVVKAPERSISTELTHDIQNRLRECLVRMMDESSSGSFDNEELRQRFKVISNSETAVYEALECMLVDLNDINEDRLKSRLYKEIGNVRRILDQDKATAKAREWSMRMAFNPESINWQTLASDIARDFDEFKSLAGTVKQIGDLPGVISTIKFDDEQSIKDSLQFAKESWSSEGVLKTMYQGLNRALGELGGFRRGEMLLIGALRHMYKSGMSRDIFISVPLCNKPYMLDASKKPLNLRISFEDSASVDIINIYQRLKQILDKEYIPSKDIDIEQASRYVHEKLAINGYHNEILEIDPGLFSLDMIVKVIEMYESKGYEIHHLNVDYLAMLTKNNNKHLGDSLTQVILNMFTQLRNVCRRKQIFLSTPHQLGADAKNALRDGSANFVKRIVGKSFYDACKRIDQEVDVEFNIHKEEVNGESYLTVQRGKHRGVNNTPESHKYFVLKFDPFLGLPADWQSEPQYLLKVGGDTMAEGGSGPLWEVD